MKIEQRKKEVAESGAASGLQEYQKPRVLHRESIEVMAGICPSTQGGKGDPTCTTQFT